MLSKTFKENFGEIIDPRIERCKKHKLLTVIGISLVGVVCGCDSWVEIEEYALEKEDFLSKVFEMPNGVPSHDTIGRLMRAIDPEEFNSSLVKWTENLMQKTSNEVIAIDGKCLRGSGDKSSSKRWITTVNAWACSNQLALGQYKVDKKSNEITAIPHLLDMLDISDTIITIDAMGTQKPIAKKIIDNNADYMLSLKANHGQLYEEVESLFKYIEEQEEIYTEESHDKGHGRIESRRVKAVSIEQAKKWIPEGDLSGWTNLQSIVQIQSTRTLEDAVSEQSRYYISSLKINELEGKKLIEIIRSHWGIENQLHWTLDVCFKEDLSQVRSGHADENFSIIRKLALNLLKRYPYKASIKRKRMKAGWNNDFLLNILKQL